MVIWFILFGTAFWLLDLNRSAGEEEQILPGVARVWMIDAFVYAYLIGLGEFELDGISEGSDVWLFYVLFTLSTFLIMIVFLNMLIAIMSDTFARVTQAREKHFRITSLRIMNDYITLLDDSKIGQDSSFSYKKFLGKLNFC